MNLEIFIFISFSYCRIFRLKHPKQEIFASVEKFFAMFDDLSRSTLFEDSQSRITPGTVNVKVKNSMDQALTLNYTGNIISYYRNGGRNQEFRAIHLSRDVVAIESAMGGCIEHKNDNSGFTIADCKYWSGYLEQTFLITDEQGIWHGFGIFETAYTNAYERGVIWGVCSTCIPGGFGSPDQGRMFDHMLGQTPYLPGFPFSQI